VQGRHIVNTSCTCKTKYQSRTINRPKNEIAYSVKTGGAAVQQYL